MEEKIYLKDISLYYRDVYINNLNIDISCVYVHRQADVSLIHALINDVLRYLYLIFWKRAIYDCDLNFYRSDRYIYLLAVTVIIYYNYTYNLSLVVVYRLSRVVIITFYYYIHDIYYLMDTIVIV